MAYAPRSYQRPFWQAFSPILHDWEHAPCKRGILPWHRRAGKDLTLLNFVEKAMVTRSGAYYHILPSYTQAKKIIWDGKDKQGVPFLKVFRPELEEARHETELKITYRPTDKAPYGSIYQLVGGEQIDSVVGTNPVGCIFSEYPLMTPRAWDLIRPILRENGGWALFCYTPRGKNHGWKLWDGTKDSGRWFRQLLTVEDTFRDAPGENGERVVTDADIQDDRDSGMSEELIRQEYYCSFEGAMEGAYYASQITLAEQAGRITDVPYDRNYPVDTAWDFGMDDQTAIWFSQRISPVEHRCIDYLEGQGNGLDWYIRELRRRGYTYGRHYAPHDVKVREYSTGNTRLQFAATQGVHFEPQPKLAVEDGIEAGRRLIAVSAFDAANCEMGINALRSYHREKDERLGTFKNVPTHDWASHGADAWRTRAVAWSGTLGGGAQQFADIRYRLHWKHEENAGAEKAELGDVFSRKQAPEARGRQTEAEYGDDWWTTEER